MEEDKKAEKNRKMWKNIGLVGGSGLVVVAIILGLSIKDFPVGVVIALILGGLVAALLFSKGEWFDKLFGKHEKDKSEVPEQITIEQAEEIIEKQLKSPKYSDYYQGWNNHEIQHLGTDGNQAILFVKLNPTPFRLSEHQYFMMNLHYPEKKWNYYPEKDELSRTEINNRMQKLAVNPSQQEREERTETDLSTGKTTTYKKTTPKQKKKEEKQGGFE